MKIARSLFSMAIFCGLLPASGVFAQSTSTLTQTVSQRNTIGVLTLSPTSGVTAGCVDRDADAGHN